MAVEQRGGNGIYYKVPQEGGRTSQRALQVYDQVRASVKAVSGEVQRYPSIGWPVHKFDNPNGEHHVVVEIFKGDGIRRWVYTRETKTEIGPKTRVSIVAEQRVVVGGAVFIHRRTRDVDTVKPSGDSGDIFTQAADSLLSWRSEDLKSTPTPKKRVIPEATRRNGHI